MKSKNKLYCKFGAIILLYILLYACNPANDDELLLVPDGHGDSYLTPLGSLRQGPWEVYEGSNGYNEAIYLNGKKLSSKPYPYTELQKDLVFDLDRGGNIRFWFKSEIGSTTDTLIRIGDTILTGLPLNDRQLQKVYTTGFWKMNFKDSTLVLNFGTKLPEIHFKYSTSEGSLSSFQQITFFDSLYNGKKVTFKKVITTSYEHPYVNF